MDTLQQPAVQALAKALLHFLWQGAALALGLHAVIRLYRPRADRRYALGVACLAAMCLAPIVTAVILRGDPIPSAAVATSVAATTSVAAVPVGAGAPSAGAAWTVRGAIVCA